MERLEQDELLAEPFMHLAVTGKAKVLVSGDRDLLAIAAAFEQASGCQVLTLEAFCKTCEVSTFELSTFEL